MTVASDNIFYIGNIDMDVATLDAEEAFIFDHPDYFVKANEHHGSKFSLIKIPIHNMDQHTTELVNI